MPSFNGDEPFLQTNKKKNDTFGLLKESNENVFGEGKIFTTSKVDTNLEKNYSVKNQMFQHFTFINQNVASFSSFFHNNEKSSKVEVDLNNPQIFYEKIHGLLSQQFIKKAKKQKKA